jgi:predicted metal-dependent HD superfamily phosphohydrolase
MPMAIYIDPPAWPAHGTVFSHVVSDLSLRELHAFARGAGISERAFDRDHYDVPAHRFQDLVQLGAVPVSGHQLVRLLADSGLRVKTRDRPEKLRGGLLRRWQRLRGPTGSDAARGAWDAVGQDLLNRWSEPQRHYHALPHLLSVLRVSSMLEGAGELRGSASRSVPLAAWFHDAVYEGKAGEDEEESAQLAQQQLDSLLPDAEVDEVGRLIRLTATHLPQEGDVTGAILTDADLEVLGRPYYEYLRYVSQVRADYAHVDDENFARGRAAVLHRLLTAPRLFHTRTGYVRWEAAARNNLEAELSDLERAE